MVEDKFRPVFTCPDPDTIFCTLRNYVPKSGTITDNCTPSNQMVKHVVYDSMIMYADCMNPLRNNLIGHRKISCYYTDASGNRSDTCVQYVYFKKFLEDNKALLKADFVLNADDGQEDENTPSITVSLRGAVQLEFAVKTADVDGHSGEFGGTGIVELFTNTLDPAAHPYYAQIAGLKVSAHFLVRRDGAIVQFVATDMRAWHAGVSQWNGRDRCNDFSIGIELEGSDHHGDGEVVGDRHSGRSRGRRR